jgi:hypothetical protein
MIRSGIYYSLILQLIIRYSIGLVSTFSEETYRPRTSRLIAKNRLYDHFQPVAWSSSTIFHLFFVTIQYLVRSSINYSFVLQFIVHSSNVYMHIQNR